MNASAENVGKFTINTEEWANNVRRIESYFKRNDINDDVKKKAILLCVVGSENYKLLRGLSAPLTPADKSYEQLKHIISTHLQPPSKETNIIAERFAFNTRNRKPMESVYSFIEELRILGKSCEYGNMLDDMVRDRLVIGIGDLDIQYKLISEGSKLTLDDALRIIKSMERKRDICTNEAKPTPCFKEDNSENEKDHKKEKSDSVPKKQTKQTFSVQNAAPTQVEKEKNSSPLITTNEELFNKDNNKTKNNKKKDNTNKKAFKNDCFRCGNDHRQETCGYIDAKCFLCKNKGHSINMCYAIRAEQMKAQNACEENEMILSERSQEQSLKQESLKCCFRCGKEHDPQTCLFKEQECFVCKNTGHSIRMCTMARAAFLDQEQLSCGDESNVHYMPSSTSENSRKTLLSESINTKLSALQKASELSQSVCFSCGSCQNSYQNNKDYGNENLETCSNTTTIPEDTLSYCSEERKSPLPDSQQSNVTDCFHCGTMCTPNSCPSKGRNYLQPKCVEYETFSHGRGQPHNGHCHHSSHSESTTTRSNNQYAKCSRYVEPSDQSGCSDKKSNMGHHNRDQANHLCHQFA